MFSAQTPYFRFGKIVSLVNRALIANSVFFKTLSRSINTSFMIKGGSQGVLNAKITDPKYLFLYQVSSNEGLRIRNSQTLRGPGFEA